jgi:hypothetical protein
MTELEKMALRQAHDSSVFSEHFVSRWHIKKEIFGKDTSEEMAAKLAQTYVTKMRREGWLVKSQKHTHEGRYVRHHITAIKKRI